MKGWHWLAIGAGAAGAVTLVVARRPHWVGLAPAPATTPGGAKLPTGAIPAAAATSSASSAPARPATVPAVVGQRVEAQYRDGAWYGGTVQKTSLGDPDAIRWDAGTPPALANPSTGTSPALAVRPAPGAAPSKPSPLAALPPIPHAPPASGGAPPASIVGLGDTVAGALSEAAYQLGIAPPGARKASDPDTAPTTVKAAPGGKTLAGGGGPLADNEVGGAVDRDGNPVPLT